MDVVSVEAVPYDRRLYYKKSHDVGVKDEIASSTIFASALSKIGWLHYDPYLLCDGRCYTGLDLNSTGFKITSIFLIIACTKSNHCNMSLFTYCSWSTVAF